MCKSDIKKLTSANLLRHKSRIHWAVSVKALLGPENYKVD